MNFDLTDEQQMLQAAAREFLAARLKSERIRELAESDDAFSEDLWREMSELNWPGLMVSETYGGQELGMVELVVLMEQLGYALVPGPIFSSMLAAIALETAATDEQKERFLAPLATGEQRGTLALWDAGAGWTPDDVTLEPEPAGGGHLLRGEKLFVLDAATADFFIVGATDDRRFIVERDAEGVSIVPTPTIDTTRKQYAVKLDGVKVGEEAEFGGPGAMEPARVRAYTAVAAELAGIAQRTLEMAVEYAKERQQFNRPIGAYQAVSHRCAQMLLETEGARSACLLRRMGGRQRARDRAARRVDGQGLCLGRRHPRDRCVASGPRWHRLHVGARPPPVPEASHRGRRDVRRRALAPGAGGADGDRRRRRRRNAAVAGSLAAAK